jgi:hypothetical protein
MAAPALLPQRHGSGAFAAALFAAARLVYDRAR